MPFGGSDLLAALSTYYEAGVYPSTIVTPGVMTSTAASTTSQTTTAFTSQTSSAGSVPSQSRSTGLSAGAKVGISFGVALGLFLVGAALYFLLRRRRKGKSHDETDAQGKSPEVALELCKPELTGHSSRMEMDAVPPTHEVPSIYEVHQMPHAQDDPGL